jgi:hypothetical protein
MDGKIIFCNDGVLRFKSDSDESQVIPLASIQESLKIPSHRFFLQNLTKIAILEKGSTMGSFIMCLDPWSETASDILDRNVTAYVDEVRKPSLAENVFDRVEIKKLIYVTRDIDFGEMPEDMDFMEWLNTPRDPVLLDTFSMDTQIDICGYSDDEDSNYSMTGTSIKELKNVPLVINKITTLVEHNSGIYAEKGEVINMQVSGTKKYDYMNCLESKADTTFTFFELIETVFCQGLFFESPRGSEGLKEMLKESMEEVKALEEKRTQPDLREVKEDGTLEDKKMEVKIADGAFSSVISHFEQEKEEWSTIINNIDKDSRYPVRIGKIEEDSPKDERIRGFSISRAIKDDGQ